MLRNYIFSTDAIIFHLQLVGWIPGYRENPQIHRIIYTHKFIGSRSDLYNCWKRTILVSYKGTHKQSKINLARLFCYVLRVCQNPYWASKQHISPNGLCFLFLMWVMIVSHPHWWDLGFRIWHNRLTTIKRKVNNPWILALVELTTFHKKNNVSYTIVPEESAINLVFHNLSPPANLWSAMSCALWFTVNRLPTILELYRLF